MQNTNSNSNLPSNPLPPLDWATRFVPLPPTDFPDDVAIDDLVNERPVDTNTTSQTPLNNAGLPCLKDIAGVDPFFTPTQAPLTTPPALANSDAAISAQSSLASNSSASPLNDPALNQNPVQQPNHDVATPPRVEVIGQQANQPPAVSLQNEAAQQISLEQNQQPPEVKLTNESVRNRPTVEIHDYDLATKVPANMTGAEPKDSQEKAGSAEQNATTELNITSYWNQNNVSCFMPGITPSEAYPVCQEYVEQISASGESESLTLSDIQLDQLLATAADIKSDTASTNEDAAETSQSDQGADVTTVEKLGDMQTESTVQPNATPLQIDPFEEEAFESTVDVGLVKLTNRFNLQTQTPPKAESDRSKLIAPVPPFVTDSTVDEVKEQSLAAESAAEDSGSHQDHTVDHQLPESLEAPKPEPLVPETPNLAARQIITPSSVDTQQPTQPSVGPSISASQSVAVVIPQLPNAGDIYQESDSSDLFESVEKSLSDLQSINHCDSNFDCSPSINAAESLSAVWAPPAEDSTNGLVNSKPEPDAVEQIDQTELQSVVVPDEKEPAAQIQIMAPTFEPIDLTAHLPSVQAEAETQPPAEPEVYFETPVVGHALPEIPPVPIQTSAIPAEFHSMERTILQAVQPQAEQVQQPVEPIVSEETSEPVADPTCQVLEVDGNDGYDFIDLKAFNVAHAAFCPGKILLDDGTTKFQIQYRNLTLAVFADDFQVELS